MPAKAKERLTPAEGYRLWAPTYGRETAVSALEERIVRGVLPDMRGRRLLDAGCGVGRRARSAGGALGLVVCLDLVPEMLRAAREQGPRLGVVGDVRSLPFASASFDLLWCRLVLGHVEDLAAPYRELARVSAVPATLVISDFHPAAVAAGHSRSFRDERGRTHEIEHHVHEASHHEAIAASFGWRLVTRVDAPAGEYERAFYERAGRLDQLDAERDIPLVLVMCFQR